MIELINRLLAFIEAFLRKKESKEAQHEVDELEANPNDWFNDHFGGVQSDDAEKANKADTDSNA